MKCTKCQSEIVPGARVCKACGHPVTLNPSLEDLYFSRLSANAPPAFVQKVRSAPYLAKERRMVTAVLFTVANVDMFTEHVPEEERTPILNQALERFAGIIFQYEGTIAKLWENTVLAFFGAPISHEDDPLRAVNAALAILDDVKEISAEVEGKYGIPFQLYMVVNTGPIVIGEIKSNLKFDFHSLNYTLECMDLAIREDIPRCQVILFDDTYRYIKPFVECVKLDEIQCTEIEMDLHLWQLTHITHAPNNVSRQQLTSKSIMIGRENELDLLMELSETVLAGLGRVGLILGEPGIGKTRLILEWKHRIRFLLQPTRILWIEAHGLAFGRELAYHLLKDLVRSALEIPATAKEQVLKQTLTQALENLMNHDAGNLYTYLAHLLDIRLSDEEEEQIHRLNATELRNQYLNAVRTVIRNLALEQPLIILFEDLHWADASSIDLIIELLSLASTSPILICLVSRPDRNAIGWRLIIAAREEIGPRLTEITLENLSEDESQALVKNLIEIEEIPDAIRDIVLKKSEGNPYFIEELVRMLVDEGVLIKNNDHWGLAPEIDPNKIPDSLQGLLSAHIDRLPAEARLTLRVASVIGREFSEQVIEAVMEGHAPNVNLMEQLSMLESIGMVKVARVNPELTYKFQHILLHDATYHSIFESDLTDLHLSVGIALERLYPDQKERLASQLAHHFTHGQDEEKALTYLDLAGHVSMDSFANAEAETYFKQALELTQDTDRLAHLYTDFGESLAQQSKHREAIQAWKHAVKFHAKLQNYDRLARVYAWSARSAWWGYDPKRSLELCLEGLEAVQGAVESPDIAYLIHETGRSYLFNNQPEKAKQYSEQALEMAKRLNAIDVQAEALATIGILPNIKPQQAMAALEMAVNLSESNNLFGPASRAYINLAAIMDNLGEIRLARDYQKRAIQLGAKAGGVSDELMINRAIARASLWLADFDDAEMLIEQMRQGSRQKDAYLNETTLSLLLLEGQLAQLRGNFSLAMEIFTDLIDRSRQINDLERVVQANRSLAEVILESHLLEDNPANKTDIDITLSMINDAMRGTGDSHTANDVETHCLLSSIYAIKGNLDKADEALRMASFHYRQQPSMQDRVRIVVAKARVERARGNFTKALNHLDESLEMVEKMEGRWWRARIWLEMGDLHLKRNEPEDVDQAQSLFREALSEFKEMSANYYPEVILEKLRQVKNISRAQAIAHKKITQELAEAGRVQNTFLPTRSPEIPGYEITGVLLPARETSGDFFDFIEFEDGTLGIVIADVGDKGAGAALYMAMSRTLIRTYAGEDRLAPKEVIHHVNRRILSDTQRGIYLTLVFGILDPHKNTFTYVNAGHNPPYLLKNDAQGVKATELTKTGTLLGIFGENTWESKTLQIDLGDVLVLYTDGITEAQTNSGSFYGSDRLIRTLVNQFNPSAEQYRNAILENVQAFTGNAPRLDDITLVVIAKK